MFPFFLFSYLFYSLGLLFRSTQSCFFLTRERSIVIPVLLHQGMSGTLKNEDVYCISPDGGYLCVNAGSMRDETMHDLRFSGFLLRDRTLFIRLL